MIDGNLGWLIYCFLVKGRELYSIPSYFIPIAEDGNMIIILVLILYISNFGVSDQIYSSRSFTNLIILTLPVLHFSVNTVAPMLILNFLGV